MRTRTVTLVEFDGMEFQTLKRVLPLVPIAFPTDALYKAERAGGERALKAAKRQWEGRWLAQVCKTMEEWDARAIWAALDAAVTLEAVLEAQSDRAYWERELPPPPPAGWADRDDPCAVLAESRAAQLRDLRDALEVLTVAKATVGPVPEERIPVKMEGV